MADTITDIADFKSIYLIKNGEVVNETNLNRAQIQLKTEIDLINTTVQNINVNSDGTITALVELGITATADEINALGGAGCDNADFSALAQYSDKFQYLANLAQDVTTLGGGDGDGDGDGGTSTLLSLGLTNSNGATAYNWAAGLYTAFNSAITSAEISKLYGLDTSAGTIETRLQTLSDAIASASTGGATIYTSSLSDTDVTASDLDWLHDNKATLSNVNTTIGTSSSYSGSGANVISSLSLTNGVITSLSSRNLTAADLGISTSNFVTTSSLSSTLSSYALSTHTHSGYVMKGAVNSTNSSTEISGKNTSAHFSVINSISGSSAGSSGHGIHSVTNGNGNIGNFAIVGKTYSTSGFGVWSVTNIRGDKAYFTAVNNFTGSHKMFTSDNITDANVGDILVNVDTRHTDIKNSFFEAKFANGAKDKKAIGVLSSSVVENSDDIYNLMGENDTDRDEVKAIIENNNFKVIEVNSLGEGAINVCELGGDIDNGDYITTSLLVGKGMKQDDDLLHNYTVAKAMTTVIWANEVVGENGCFEVNGVKCKLIGCTYHCG